MRLKKYTIFFFVCLSVQILRGQINEDKNDDLPKKRLETILKTSIISPLDPWSQAISVYVEQELPTKKWQSIELEYGHIYNAYRLSEVAYGHRFRTAYRRYIGEKEEERNLYISASFSHRRLYDEGIAFLWRRDRQYQQELSYKVRVLQESIALNIGKNSYLGRKQHWLVDISIGLGIRQNRVNFFDMPIDAEPPRLTEFITLDFRNLSDILKQKSTYYYVSVPIAMKLGYCF